ncbi:MAG: TetR/AcrR family transcriptional regulator [Sphingobacteriales bacterium]|nr:MAG: TetR/AcrR family transcriptional regulator [Sphingobacteriales bacterium]
MKITHPQIIDAAITVFNTDPSATVEAVAEKAGITSRTLYRYFNDRAQLLSACKDTLAETCKAAMGTAFASGSDALQQLELTLYAGIKCGTKYAFFDKLNQAIQQGTTASASQHNEFGQIKQQWVALVIQLQDQGVITHDLTPAWIFKLFSGMINTTISAIASGDVALNDVERFAWISFSNSLGIKRKISA